MIPLREALVVKLSTFSIALHLVCGGVKSTLQGKTVLFVPIIYVFDAAQPPSPSAAGPELACGGCLVKGMADRYIPPYQLRK